MKAASALDYRELARRRLPRFLFEYLDGGSYAEITLGRNVQDLASIALRQRVLRDVGRLDLSCELFGQKLALPVALGPIGLAGLTARRGEVQAARAAEAAGVPFCLSTVALCPLAEVTRATKQPLWLQLYMIRDRAFMRDLLTHARAAHCSALVFTVEDNALAGGFGSAVNEYWVTRGYNATKLFNLGLPDRFIDHGDRDGLMAELGLDAAGLVKSVLEVVGTGRGNVRSIAS